MVFWSRVFAVIFLLVLFGSMVFASAPQISIPTQRVVAHNNFIDNVVNLHAFAHDNETPDEQLAFRIVSQSNRNDIECFVDMDTYIDCFVKNDGISIGSTTVEVEVTDKENLGTRGTFGIIFETGNSGSSLCSDIDIRSRTIRLDEDSTESFSFEVVNLSGSKDFFVRDVRFDESGSAVSFSSNDFFDDTIPADGVGEISFDVESFNVSSDREVIAKVRISGEFENGVRCSFDSVSSDFRVIVDDSLDSGNGSFSSNACNDIVVDDARILLDESDLQTVDISVSNENNRGFRVTSVSLNESELGFSVFLSTRPAEIGGGDEEDVRLRFETKNVSRNETGKIFLGIGGTFSNGKSCSTTSTRQQIPVTVENTGSGSQGNDDDISIRFSPPVVELLPGASKFLSATVENNSLNRKCVELDLSGLGNGFSLSLDEDSFCISAGNERTVDISLSANQSVLPGNYSASLLAGFGSKNQSETLSVRVLGTVPTKPHGNLEILSIPSVVSLVSDDVEFFPVTVSNSSGQKLSNIAITMDNLPQGVFFQPYFRQSLEKGEIITANLRIESANAQAKQFDALLRVSSDAGTVTRPVRVVLGSAGAVQPDGGPGIVSGLLPLAGTVGVGLALLALLTIIVVIIILLVRR